MVETPKSLSQELYIYCDKWPFGCEVLMRDVSTDQEGGPFNFMG